MKIGHLAGKRLIFQLLKEAGVEPNGNHSWDIQIHDERFYAKVLDEQSVGLGESYMDGWWDCPRIDQFLTRILESKIEKKIKNNFHSIFFYLTHKLFNSQTKTLSKDVSKKHYNLGNKLYQLMLDKEMNYSCGYWKDAKNLDEAQQQKMELICQKLMLKPGMRVLDIGCGWGALAKYAAINYGVEVLGITISSEQKALAEQKCKGLNVKIELMDYRDLPGKGIFDRIVSVGMFEHVGYKNYLNFFKVAHRCLIDNGIFLLHTIGGNQSWVSGDPWVDKYIFPHGMLPSISQIGKSIEDLYVMEDWHNFGLYYDKTLLAWHKNFNDHWPEIKSEYNERFFRMWNYYLLSCAAGFRSRNLQLWQIVLSKNGLKEGFYIRDLGQSSEHRIFCECKSQ